MIKFAHKHKISIISDVVDWLAPSSGGFFFKIIKKIDTWLLKAWINKKSDGIIAITKWLEHYYQNKGVKNICLIPPLSKTNNYVIQLKDIPQIIYAGTPFRVGDKNVKLDLMKDRIDKSIHLLCLLKRNKGVMFRFHIFGFSEKDLIHSIPMLQNDINELGSFVVFHGKVPMKEIYDNFPKMDYMLLIREINKSTTAGFPSKVSESISFGVPVITTKTSDISDYLVDNQSVFYLSNSINQDLDMLKMICTIDKTDREKRKKECLLNNPFDNSIFQNKLKEFLGVLEK